MSQTSTVLVNLVSIFNSFPSHSCPPFHSKIQALNALNSLLKGQVELFRLVQADARSESTNQTPPKGFGEFAPPTLN